MNIYDPIADALNLPPIPFDYNRTHLYNPLDLVEGVDYFPSIITPSWNKGVSMSEEQKHNHSIKMKGRKRSIEARAAISRRKMGKKRKPFSEETKIKISQAAKRQWLENPPVRKPMSAETKRKISATKKAINRDND